MGHFLPQSNLALDFQTCEVLAFNLFAQGIHLGIVEWKKRFEHSILCISLEMTCFNMLLQLTSLSCVVRLNWSHTASGKLAQNFDRGVSRIRFEWTEALSELKKSVMAQTNHENWYQSFISSSEFVLNQLKLNQIPYGFVEAHYKLIKRCFWGQSFITMGTRACWHWKGY